MDSSGIGQFIPLILIFVIFYFFLIRPQQKKVKEHKAMVEGLKKGDKVVTSGGITGVITRVVDNENKVTGFSQWSRNYPTNEFGLSVGGKFYGKSDNQWTGRSLVFSNRGEVEAIEKLVESYNKMDVEGCKTAFADKVNIQYEDGRKVVFTPNMWEGYFKDYRSVNWKLYSIVPLKIYDTDPASGVVVTSREKRVMRNGKVWERELVEWFYFNLDGKIDNMTQFSRKIK